MNQSSVCFFIQTSTAEAGDGRDRVPAVVETWAADIPDQSRVFYVTDDLAPPYHMPSSVKTTQVIKTIHQDYDKLPERTRLEMIALNTRHLKDRCGWFVVADDDAYVNSVNIMSKLRNEDASKL